MKNNFHSNRARELREKFPELKRIPRHAPETFVLVLAVVGLQIALAKLASGIAWPWLLLLAYCVGSFVSHALLILIHEGTHDHIFSSKNANILAAIVANLPLILPVAISLRYYHLFHHSHLNDVRYDGDSPSPGEVRWVGNSTGRKLIWLAVFPFVMMNRSRRLGLVKVPRAWRIVNLFVEAIALAVMIPTLGGKGIAFLGLSLYLGTTLHPLGARWLQDHFVVVPGQTTNSYYGAINWVAFNIGYHNEHHDFPAAPWKYMPRIRRTCREVYGKLYTHPSWTGLLYQFLCDRRATLAGREYAGILDSTPP